MGSSTPSGKPVNGIPTHPGQDGQIPPQVTNQRLNPGHSPFQIASEPKIRDVRISPDGTLILYQVTPFYRAGDRTVSELWLAETDKPQSVIQLTSGEFNDRGGVFHPDGTRILFLSDRQTLGKGTHIYTLSLGQPPLVDYLGHYHDGSSSNSTKPKPEPHILSSKFGKKGVQGFEISPDGNWVAFTSPDESTPEELRKIQEKNDAKLIGLKDGLSKLRAYNLGTDEIRTFRKIPSDRHVEGFAWSSDSKRLLYRLRENKGTEWTEFEVLLQSISIQDEDAPPESLGSYPRSPSGSNVWLSSGHIASLQNYEPQDLLDARTLHIHRFPTPQVDNERIYGVDEDAVRILRAHTPHPSIAADLTEKDFLAVEVSHDTDSHIDIITFSASEPHHTHKLPLFHTFSDAIWFNSWDAKRVSDPSDPSDPSRVTYVFAAVLSSGPRHEPPNVWSGRIQARVDDTGVERLVGDAQILSRSGGNLTQLSDHLEWLVKAPVLRTEVIRWKSKDGADLSGLVRFPPDYNPETDGRLPTLLFLHGGPYRRDTPDYMPYFCNWRELGASAGYLTISPNYRGSQGRGHVFATTASAGIGVYDWPDCESMVDEVVARGWADSNRLGVAGWSHGASLAAWGVTQTKNRYKAVVVGGGATHWENMAMASGSPELEIAIGQSSPWGHPSNSMKTFTSERKTSPIHNVADVETAVLILHGERDERMPLGQAYGFYRGLKRCAAPRGRDAVQLVVYPREPHGFSERRHAQDVLERVLIHFNTYI